MFTKLKEDQSGIYIYIYIRAHKVNNIKAIKQNIKQISLH